MTFEVQGNSPSFGETKVCSTTHEVEVNRGSEHLYA